ncbi:CBS domain-containing protein [Thermogemmatispora sp.]|uniref:CBS domain-containing protein n=1 Tax=Thermogemmatispora sp. TaxID=1968838 RepID=UPI001D6769C2|nr:CBS domain-containing protein [Thermogemmatispora sp.]MBX5450010.1 CBS domain-containing protein [Thermogemmatispora sp.]
MSRKVKDVMTTSVVTVREDQTRQQAAALMARHRISGLPVVNEEGMITGLVTEHDVLARQGQLVREIMTRSLISVSEETELEDVAQLLVNRRIRRLPVLREGRLVGIISRADLVREVATRWTCPVCGEVAPGEEPPESCPRCAAPQMVAPAEPAPPGF